MRGQNSKSIKAQLSIQVYADKFYSVETILSYDYDSFDFCQDSLKKTPSETLGKMLSGQQTVSCPYKFSFNKEEICRKVCVKYYAPHNEDQMNKLAFLKEGIKNNYYHHWVIDDTRVIWCYDMEDGEHYCELGCPIGCFNTPSGQLKGSCLTNPEFNKNNSLYLFNHFDITITYDMENDTTRNGARLISSRVDPKSYNHLDENHLTCNEPPLEIPEDNRENLNVIYTYSVKFEKIRSTEWSSERDHELESTTKMNIRWIRLVTSFFVVLFLCELAIATILKGIFSDVAKYSGLQLYVYNQRQSGRRNIHGNVFSPPEHRMLLSVFIGQGTQIFVMTFFSLYLAGLGFLTPADQNVLMNYAIVLWLLLQIPAGYVSAKMYKTLNGRNWKMHFMLTSLLFPGIVFTDIFIMNLILWMEGSSAAISIGILASVFAVCFGISTPLTFLGVYFGKKQKFDFPVQTQETSRVCPKRNFFKKPTIILSSLLSFGCIFLQLSYMLNNIWSPHMYYLFAFLFISFSTILIACLEVTILLFYFLLCAEVSDNRIV
ncbi:hypothetical protein STEG23_015181 [Scotinomys teguina]